ncbi:hypothetical protein Lgra_0685 [Legionella gratiana]|uniref:Uncharacterized protein n=1 Tax=Legionella gratiana TaxID=45066 RepID=A0A378J3Q8_9GAMM|nr:hypothetical protein [Legionella gratiana]KTD14654.1 hypothetical protein Lgra_0685 [Legionella gratiana]STX41601.1 Uncharacterised protein [Legionella gratiana]
MSTKKNFIGINVETLVLVAVWETPFIFQGCFKINELQGNNTVLFFFRSQTSHVQQSDILHKDFLSEQYDFTHLYNEEGLIQLNNLDQVHEDALYLLKYALHVTLGKMLSSRKMHFTSIDDIAMQALIDRVRPILNRELTLPEEEHIGFAVAMDFCPEEETALLPALALLRKLKNTKNIYVSKII